MTISYEYSVEGMQKLPEEVNGCSDVVVNVYFKVVATEIETNKTSLYRNNANLLMPESSNNFIPLSDLTENQVIEFVKQSLGQGAIDTIEEVLADTLTNSSEVSIPWNN